MSAKSVAAIPENGTELFIPLNKLKKSSKNARKVPHSEAAIAAYAASIAAKGILQNLVVFVVVSAKEIFGNGGVLPTSMRSGPRPTAATGGPA
jgi:hypothetical protein